MRGWVVVAVGNDVREEEVPLSVVFCISFPGNLVSRKSYLGCALYSNIQCSPRCV